MNNIDTITAYYSEWWENPRDIRNLVFQSLNRLVESRIPPAAPGARALDIGAGCGMIVSFLVEKGYTVTAVDLNEDFVRDLRGRFLDVQVIHADISDFDIEEAFDIVTMIELSQNLEHVTWQKLLEKLFPKTGRLLTNISNQHSLHGFWAELRGFRAPFVFPYTPSQLDEYLAMAGFRTVYTRGVGLVTPISLLSNFRIKLIPDWFARTANRLERYAGRICHLYYVEALGAYANAAPPSKSNRF